MNPQPLSVRYADNFPGLRTGEVWPLYSALLELQELAGAWRRRGLLAAGRA